MVTQQNESPNVLQNESPSELHSERSSSWGRFSLRMLLMMTTLAAIIFAVWAWAVEPYRRQDAAMKRYVEIQLQQARSQARQMLLTMQLRSEQNTIETSEFTDGGWQARLVRFAVGRGAYRKVRKIQLPAKTSEEDIGFIVSRMPFLNSLELSDSDISPEIARLLAASPELETLFAKRSDITDDELESIANSKTIKLLSLAGNPITDNAVDSLAQMNSLESVFVRWTEMTQEGVDDLRNRMPECEVFFVPHN